MVITFRLGFFSVLHALRFRYHIPGRQGVFCEETPYNNSLKFFTTVAKAALILAGAGFGLVRGLRLLEGLSDHSAELEALEERLDGIQLQIAALHARDEQFQARLDSTATRDEFTAALDKGLERVQSGVEARFEEEARSVEALRAMVSQTDELLERVLDRLEALRNEAEMQKIGT